MSAANLPDAGMSPPGPNFIFISTGDEHRPLATPIDQISRKIKSKHISKELDEEYLKESLQPIKNNPSNNFDVVLFLGAILLLKTTISMQKLGARIADAQRLLQMTEERIKSRQRGTNINIGGVMGWLGLGNKVSINNQEVWTANNDKIRVNSYKDVIYSGLQRKKLQRQLPDGTPYTVDLTDIIKTF